MSVDIKRYEAALALQVKVELVERGMDQGSLASALGIERATLNRYMRGHRSFPMPLFFRIAETFGVPPSEMFRRADVRIAAQDAAGAKDTAPG